MNDTNRQASLSAQELDALIAEESTPAATPWGRYLFSGLLVLLLCAALFGQYVWFQRPQLLLQHPYARPVLERVCVLLGCRLPSARALHSLKITERYMGRHTEAADATLVQFNFVNTAPFPQAYPQLEIRFEDENKQLVARRRFQPQDYLSDFQYGAELPSGAPVYVKLEFANVLPAMHSYGFTIAFLPAGLQ